MANPLVGILVATAFLPVAWPALAQTRDRSGIQFDQRLYPEGESEDQEGVEGQKLCSVYIPDRWRDTFPVPRSWRWSDCRDFAERVGASHVHLMCLFERGDPKTSMGGPGDLPEPNCGWGRGGRKR